MTAAERKEKHAVEEFPYGQAESGVPVRVPGKSIQQTARHRGLRHRERSGQETAIKGKKWSMPLE